MNEIKEDRLSPEAKLELMAEILAQAIRRSLKRQDQLGTKGISPVFKAESSREQLACHQAKSVHGARTRPRKETR